MNQEQQRNLIEFGQSMDILVSPVIITGQFGVAYCADGYTTDYVRAHRDLLGLKLGCAAAA